ncbi:hypothetical protein [Pseudomonas sp. TWP3-2]|uniref:hypothetical protein n=1 Tax=Pseudomonas sp. TWP3-2 TaxID=2804574 RepID=UPI003CEB13D4
MNGSIFGAHFMLISIGAILMTPASSIKCGNLDAKDYSNFPRGLLQLIRFVYGAGLAGAASMMTLFLGGKFMGWIQ